MRACLLLGADVNWTDRQTGSGSGLQMAAKSNSVELLELLLSDPAVRLNFWGELRPLTPLDLACEVKWSTLIVRDLSAWDHDASSIIYLPPRHPSTIKGHFLPFAVSLWHKRVGVSNIQVSDFYWTTLM